MALRVGMCTALNEEMYSKLEAAGIVSPSSFVSRDPETLSQELNVSYKDICSIRRVLLAEHSAYPVSALSLYQNALSSLTILSTGCAALDDLLDGGLYTGEVTELAGDTATGKTRVCHWCAATTVKPDHHRAVYIDTCGSFHAGTLLDSISDDAADEESVQSRLSRIKCQQVFDVYELFDALDTLEVEMKKQDSSDWGRLKLVVVDNLAMLIYPIMGSSAALNQGIVSRLGFKLKQFADSFSVAVLICNNMVGSYGHSHAAPSHRKPALGKVWSHVPNTRIILSRPDVGPAFPRPLQVEGCLVKSGRQQTPCRTTFSLDRGAEYRSGDPQNG